MAALLVSVLIASPAALLFESYVFYTYPVTLLVTTVVWAFARVQRRAGTSDVALLAASAGLLCLTRALFHPLWLLATLAAGARCLATRGSLTRSKLVLLSVPALLVACIVAKNAALFGVFGLSSWRGMNLARVAIDRLPSEVRSRAVRDGTLSELSAVGSFESLDAYGTLVGSTRDTGVPVLDQPNKSNAAPNFHHRAYVGIAKQLERDAQAAIRAYPVAHLASFARNLARTMHPATEYRALAPIRSSVALQEALWEPLRLRRDAHGSMASAWALVPLLWACAIVFASRTHGAARTSWIYLAMTVLFVIGVGALLERSENERFRFTIDPLLWMTAGVLVSACAHAPARQSIPLRP